MTHEEKYIMRYILLLSCAKKGYISIKKAIHKLDWSKQKVLAVGQSLCDKGVLEKDFTKGLLHSEYANKLIGYHLKTF